jgi:serine/threonine protein kinase
MGLSQLKPGGVVNNRHEVLSVVGVGGMGTVLKVRRRRDGALLALKYCQGTDPDSTRRFAREVRIMRGLKHPHVISIVSTNLKHSPPYFTMPFADSSCAARLQEYKDDEDKALADFSQLCEGVQAIHNAGKVHRDIKPENALLLDGRVVVSDLGLAKMNVRDTTVLTQTRAVVGIDMYLAPEQRLPAGSREADQRTDIYQLGKTLYQFVTALPPVLLDISKVPPGLAHVVRRATRELPDDRYQTVGQLIDAVRAYQRAKAPDANPVNGFEAALAEINERRERGEFRGQDIQRILFFLDALQGDLGNYMELFDRLPKEILEVMADVFPQDFQPSLEAYVKAIDERVGGLGFSYAESVARRMGAVFRAAKATAELKALSLEATLIAAVRLNRFAAMDSFNAMLASVRSDDDAAAVREMLDRRRQEYQAIFNGVPSSKLHSTIRPLRDALERGAEQS